MAERDESIPVTLARLEGKLDAALATHTATLAEHGRRLDVHDTRLNAHDRAHYADRRDPAPYPADAGMADRRSRHRRAGGSDHDLRRHG